MRRELFLSIFSLLILILVGWSIYDLYNAGGEAVGDGKTPYASWVIALCTGTLAIYWGTKSLIQLIKTKKSE